jgi:hypothetical protein
VAIHYMKNSGRVRLKQFCQAALRMTVAELANLSNFVIRKFSESSPPAVLCNRVILIVAFGTEKQMIRTNARWIIATMENLHSIWNLAVAKKPRNAMRGHHSARIVHPEMPVTVGEFRGNPKPARFRFLNFCPEANFETFSHARQLIANAAVRVCGNFQNVHGGPLGNRSRI